MEIVILLVVLAVVVVAGVELLAGDLADGSGLAHAVDADEEPHVGLAVLEAQ